MKRHALRFLSILFVAIAMSVQSASAARLRDLCEILGARGNDLKGVGIVVGLAGTGDKTRARAAIQAQQRMLERMDIKVLNDRDLISKNTAVVLVTAVFPPYAKEGTRIDVRVSSLFDSSSLEGGTLLETYLEGVDGEVYAVSQGAISVGGFNASGGGGGAVRKNHVTAGRIPMGAYIEREIPSTITDGERIVLILKRPDFTTANNLQEAINSRYGSNSASALGAGSVNVKIPDALQANLVGFIAALQQLQVTPATLSKIVINERTGTIVVGGDVIIKPCQVAHGSLTINIANLPTVSQPLAFSGGETVESTIPIIQPDEEQAFLMPVEGTSATEVASALNKLKVTPRDMISIFQALRDVGALEADLEVM